MKTLLLMLSLSLAWAHPARAQSFCASDGQPTPLTLVERFISADCEACWRTPQALPAADALTLDWIVPSPRGDEAPLSAAATLDALTRLQALGQAAPQDSAVTRRTVKGPDDLRVRVAHGVPLGGYMGTSIELKTSPPDTLTAPLTAWLLLVETIPAGVEGSTTEKYLVRNMLLTAWDGPEQLSKNERATFRELRPLSIPPGTAPDRLQVVGWVQDVDGKVLTAARSVCQPLDEK